MILHKTNWLLEKVFYPELTWKVNTKEKVIYLTFDDGPIPEVTHFVLNTLRDFNAKATFFCVGENVQKHPDIFNDVINEGHVVGNHTFNHITGWKTPNEIYFDNILKCRDELAKSLSESTKHFKLFRPPHGRISKSQIRFVKKDYEIIMWNVLSGDYDVNLPRETCLQKSIQYSKEGTIVVFHDSLKARKNMEYALPRYLEHFSQKGFRFNVLA